MGDSVNPQLPGGYHVRQRQAMPALQAIPGMSQVPGMQTHNTSITNRELLATSPVFRLLREHPVACTWLQTSQIPSTTSPATLHNSVTKEFQCHIPVGSAASHHSQHALGVMQRRRRTLLYSPYMTFTNGITLGCVFGSKYQRDQVWGLGWEDDGNGVDDRGIRCKFVYDEGSEESLTFIWNEKKGEVAIVWVKGVSVWEMRREMFVFEYIEGATGTGGILSVLEGKRRKAWLKVRQLRACEVCGARMDVCACGAQARVDMEGRKLVNSPVDFTSFDVKVLDGVYECMVEANIYNPDTLMLLSRKTVKFTTEIVTNNGDGRSMAAPSYSYGESSASQGMMGTVGMSSSLGVPGMHPHDQQQGRALSDKLVQHLQKYADTVKIEDESVGSVEQLSSDTFQRVGTSSPMIASSSGENVEGAQSSNTKKRNAHKTQPILLTDIVNLLYRIEKEGGSGDSADESGRKRRKKRGPYRKRGEIDKATRDHERKLKNRELAHAANQKKRERTRAMEFEVRVLRKAVRSMLGYTRELEDINSILAHIVAQSGGAAGDIPQLSSMMPTVPVSSAAFPDIISASIPEEKPNII